MNINKLNLRVYAILIHEEKILVLKESYAGEKLIKLPGGGLEFGEGPKETLVREFQEELNLTIEVGEHIYTQDFFLVSKFKQNEQLMTIYYFVNALDIENLKIVDDGIDELIWIPITEINETIFQLPVDKIVAKILNVKLNN